MLLVGSVPGYSSFSQSSDDNYFSISLKMIYVCWNKSLLFHLLKIIFWGAISTVIAKQPMANAGINNQVFIFSWIISRVAGWQYYVDMAGLWISNVKILLDVTSCNVCEFWQKPAFKDDLIVSHAHGYYGFYRQNYFSDTLKGYNW